LTTSGSPSHVRPIPGRQNRSPHAR
jgi:hypothetical protein